MMENKNCRVGWIGELPKDWEYKPLRNLTYFINESNSDKRFTNVLSLLRNVGVVPYEKKGNQGNKSKDDLSNYKIAYKNTIVINSMNLKIGSVGLSRYDGCVSPVYYVLAGRKNTNICYVNYLFQTREFQKYLGSFGRGIMEIREKITKDDMKNALIPRPSLIKQKKIVQYLDEKIDIINDQIIKNKKVIELLVEYRVSIIFNTLSKSNGKKIKIKRIAQLYNGKEINVEVGESETSYPVYGSGGVFKFTNDYIYDGEAVLFGRKGSIGKPLIVNGKFWTVDTMYYSVCNRKLNSKFFYYNLIIFPWELLATQTALPSIVGTQVFAETIALPKLQEQKKITNYLDKKCERIDKVVSYRKSMIKKLEEYKKSLIYEVVTGKKEI